VMVSCLAPLMITLMTQVCTWVSCVRCRAEDVYSRDAGVGAIVVRAMMLGRYRRQRVYRRVRQARMVCVCVLWYARGGGRRTEWKWTFTYQP